MEFIDWLFDRHWVFSVVFMPWWAAAFAIFKGYAGRAVLATVIWFAYMGLNLWMKWKARN